MGNGSSQQPEHSTGKGRGSTNTDDPNTGAEDVELEEILTPEIWLEDALLLDTVYGDLSFPLSLSPDLVVEICSMLKVGDITAFTSTCTAFHQFQKTSDSVFWRGLVFRDYRFILDSEKYRASHLAMTNSQFTLRARREDLVECAGSYKNVYKEAHNRIQKNNPDWALVSPFLGVFFNHTKKVKYVFAAFDMIRGIISWDEPHISVQYGDTISFSTHVIDYGCEKTIYLHSQMVRWGFGIGDILRDIGYSGSPSSVATDIKWSYWQTFPPKSKLVHCAAKINAGKNNAVKWTANMLSTKQWCKIRHFLNLSSPYQNPGPYPEVRLKDSNVDQKPIFEYVYLLHS
jgi:hypothetical protein